MTEPADARNFALAATLRNGTPVTIRAVRPDDRPRIENAFRALDRETVYTRFFRFRDALSEQEFAQLASMDFVRDVMLVATIAGAGDEIVIAGASYHAYTARDGTFAAEVAFTVEEDCQGQGLAGRLFDALAQIARRMGIVRFEAEVLPVNKAMLAVFARTGLPMTERLEDGVVHLTLDLGSGR